MVFVFVFFFLSYRRWTLTSERALHVHTLRWICFLLLFILSRRAGTVISRFVDCTWGFVSCLLLQS